MASYAVGWRSRPVFVAVLAMSALACSASSDDSLEGSTPGTSQGGGAGASGKGGAGGGGGQGGGQSGAAGKAGAAGGGGAAAGKGGSSGKGGTSAGEGGSASGQAGQGGSSGESGAGGDGGATAAGADQGGNGGDAGQGGTTTAGAAGEGGSAGESGVAGGSAGDGGTAGEGGASGESGSGGASGSGASSGGGGDAGASSAGASGAGGGVSGSAGSGGNQAGAAGASGGGGKAGAGGQCDGCGTASCGYDASGNSCGLCASDGACFQQKCVKASSCPGTPCIDASGSAICEGGKGLVSGSVVQICTCSGGGANAWINCAPICGGGPGPQNPNAAIFHPGDGETRPPNKLIPFIGVASDPQDGKLSGAAMVWTSNLIAVPIGTGTNFDAALPAGMHTITLTATDKDGNKGTASITLKIDDQSPSAFINHPGDKEVRPANVPILFSGKANDPQDGALTGASMVWTSDQLGAPLGTGESFMAPLKAGKHVITLTATDKDGNKGSNSLTLFIQ